MASSENEARWIIAYDIACPKRLYRVAKALQNVGVRRQWSVFEAWLSPFAFAQLQRELRSLLDPAADNLRCYPVNGKPAEREAAHPGYYIL